MLVIDSVRFFRRTPMYPDKVTHLEIVSHSDCEIDLLATFEVEATLELQEGVQSLIDAINAEVAEHLIGTSVV